LVVCFTEPPIQEISRELDVAISDCYGVSLIGRLGNLMFQYAAIAGICVKKGFSPQECLKIVNDEENSTELPVVSFLESFQNINKSGYQHCKLSETTYRERSGDFDEQAFSQPLGTTFLGYYQSFKYFHPHAQEYIQHAFSFPEGTTKIATHFLKGIQRQLPPKESGNRVPFKHTVCLAVRRGDKVDETASAMYDKWALSEDYYLTAIDVFRKKYGNIVLIAFTGGSFDSAKGREDREWTKRVLIDRYENSTDVFAFSDDDVARDHLATLNVLALCPNIIVASSSFSWWGAYLANHSNVVAPRMLHVGVPFLPEDYYLPSWTLLDKPEDSSRRRQTSLRQSKP
jgi:hypothetical protein